MFPNFNEACRSAKAKVEKDGCVVHVRAVISTGDYNPNNVEPIQHRIVGYTHSDWCDDSVVATFQ